MSGQARRNEESGYSLIEVLIGMTILAIALASAFALSMNSSRLIANGQYLSSAAALADTKIEELRNLDFENVVTGADSGLLNSLGEAGSTFSRSWAVTDDSPETGLKTVVVSVSWTQWGQARTYTLGGVIGP
jgi:prepilin-type N-terminal cleavage/methylation domain-containing protein